MISARVPIMNTGFYITYEDDPVLYMYQLLDDYKEGDLHIMPYSIDSLPVQGTRRSGDFWWANEWSAPNKMALEGRA